ncbi:MAG TPA: YfhO family protein [Blastocatellia bacterium]|nr:YfhO family protein [Blastocatellia bacterium]
MRIETREREQVEAASHRVRGRYLAAAAIAMIPVVYFSPALIGKVTLAPGDGWMQNFPLRVLAGQMMARGEWPLWNPFSYGGMPLAASVYPGVFYPPNWLFAMLPAQWAMNLVVLTTYHLALAGTYLYGRRLGLQRVAALLAGIAFTLGGFMINHLSHTSRIAAAAWLPWILLAIEEVGDRTRTRRWVVLGALFIALQFLAGEPQMSIFTALAGVPCAVYAGLKLEGREERRRFAGSIAMMLLCGALLCMIQLLPALELLSQSERHDPGPAFFGTYSFPPWQLPSLIIPYFFGGATLPPYRMPYWGAENATMMAGYVGMLTWILALVAIFGARRQGRVWIWTGIAIGSMLLAFGSYLPFGLNRALYHVPGYGSFRGLYRHQLEFTFALALLGGFGVQRLITKGGAGKLLKRSIIAMGSLMAAAVILYRFCGEALATVQPRPERAGSLANPELIVPVCCFVLSGVVLWFGRTSNLKSQISNLLLLSVLLIDVASYGYFFKWRNITFDVPQRLADPPAVQFIKSRERDFSSFRVMSHPVLGYDYPVDWPEDPNFETINQPSISVLRGLQSISGYDILRPARVGELTGTAGYATAGPVQESGSFGVGDRGFDLLNLKYLIVGNGGATNWQPGSTYDGVGFGRTYFGMEFKPGSKLTTEPAGVWATELAIISSLANSTQLDDGAPVLKLKLHTKDGRVFDLELQAGRDTSEWSYDCGAGKTARHRRARVVRSYQADHCRALLYLGRLPFERAEIQRIEWEYGREDAMLYLVHASLHDATTGVSTPLNNFYLPPERWRKLAGFGRIDVYENLRARPRAWFVEERLPVPAEAALKAVRQGGLPDGGSFDPATTALVEAGNREAALPPVRYQAAAGDEVGIVNYRPHRIELETRRSGEGFLVLSEIYDPGWRAYLDGREIRVFRTDYTLRGVEVPAGRHRIELVYRPRSLRYGVICAAFGLALLIGWTVLGAGIRVKMLS